MLEEYRERIEQAKKKPYLSLEMFEIGDIVYPFFAHNLVNWGTVVDINPVTRKIVVNFNGVNRQFDPEWLIKTNPEIKTASIKNKHKIEAKYRRMVEALYYKEAPGIYKMSEDEVESGEMTCPKCGGPLDIHYDIVSKETMLKCPACGREITKSKVASMERTAGKVKELMMDFEDFAEKYPEKEIKKQDIDEEFGKRFKEWKSIAKEFVDDIADVLKKKGIKVI